MKNIKSSFVFIILITAIVSQGIELTGTVTYPDDLNWYWGSVILTQTDGDLEESYSISIGNTHFVFNELTEGKYLAQAILFTDDGTINIYYPNIIFGNCSGRNPDTLFLNTNKNIEINCPGHGSLKVQLSGMDESEQNILCSVKNNSGENCVPWLLKNDPNDMTIKYTSYIETGNYTLGINIMQGINIDSFSYEETVVINESELTEIEINLNELLPPYSFLKSPDTSSVGKMEATISWKMNEAVTCSLFYTQFAIWDTLSWEGNSATPRKEYTAHLTNLLPDRFYIYQVNVYDSLGNIMKTHLGFFRTLPSDYYFTKGPSVPTVSENSATITWRTNRPCVCSLFYADDINLYDNWIPFEGESSEKNTEFIAQLTGLERFTPYFYYIKIYSSSDSLENESNRYNLFWTLWKHIDKNFQLIGRPQILSLSDQSALISFQTDEFILGVCDYFIHGPFENPPVNSLFNPIPFNWHLVYLDSLTPATTYTYRVGTILSENENYYLPRDFHFTTLENKDTIPPILVSGPVISSKWNKAIITFAANEAVIGTINIFQQGELIDSMELTRYKKKHQSIISGLENSTKYYITMRLRDYHGNTLNWNGQENLLSRFNLLKSALPANNEFTTNENMDTIPPLFTASPFLVDHFDSSAIIRFSGNEQINYQVKIYDETNKLAFWSESDEYYYEHTVYPTRLLPATSYHGKIKIRDLAGNTDSLSGEFSFNTRANNIKHTVSVTEKPTIYQTDDYILFHWKTDLPGFGASRVSKTVNNPNSLILEDDNYKTQHIVIADQLEDENKYYYELQSFDLQGELFSQTPSDTFNRNDNLSPSLIFMKTPEVIYSEKQSVIISWENNILSYYNVEYFSFPDPEEMIAINSNQLEKEHRLIISSLEPASEYQATITVKTLEGNEIEHPISFSTKNEDFNDVEPPAPPKNLSSEIDDNSIITLSWKAGDSPDIKGYELVKSLSGTQVTISSNYSYLSYKAPFEENFVTYSIASLDLAGNKSEYVYFSPVTINTPQTGPIKNFTLFNNSPNPFSDHTKISFYNDSTRKLKILIYNIMGEIIYQEEDYFTGPGEGHFDLSTKTWPNGFYLYKITYGNNDFKTGKMLLLK